MQEHVQKFVTKKLVTHHGYPWVKNRSPGYSQTGVQPQFLNRINYLAGCVTYVSEQSDYITPLAGSMNTYKAV